MTAAPDVAVAAEQPDPGHHPRRSGHWVAVLFLAPTIIGIVVFTVVPIIASIVLAFFRWDILTPPEFVGVDNFVEIATNPTVRVAFVNTFVFVILAVTLQLGLAMWLAVLLQSRMPQWLRGFFRSSYFFPLILSAASVSLVMGYLFNEDFGLVNQVLNAVSLPDVPWLTTQAGAAVVIILVFVWQNFGFSFLLFLGGLAAIPEDVYEAAAVDGATGWSRFRHVTLPMMSPTILVASVTAIIGALQVFDQPYVLTRGGPGDSTRTAVMVIYESAFQELRFGRAFAIGIVLMLVISAVTALQFRLSRRYVFYS